MAASRARVQPACTSPAPLISARRSMAPPKSGIANDAMTTRSAITRQTSIRVMPRGRSGRDVSSHMGSVLIAFPVADVVLGAVLAIGPRGPDVERFSVMLTGRHVLVVTVPRVLGD